MAAQASLDDAIIGDPITSPVALAAILDFFAGQLAVPPDADAAVTVLQGVQVHLRWALPTCSQHAQDFAVWLA